MSGATAPRRVIVVGAGIAGIAAARALRGSLPPADEVVVLESASRTGGKLLTTDLAGVRVDQGAESFLLRQPEAADLVRASGFTDQLIHPAAGKTMLALDGALTPLPRGTMMGVPGELDALAASGVLDPAALARVRRDASQPGDVQLEDISVGAYVGARLGRAVVERLVDPLLGGVYSGTADGLSLRATVPALAAAAATHRSVLDAVRAASAQPAAPGSQAPGSPTPGGPTLGGQAPASAAVFGSLHGGLGSWADALVGELGDAVRTGVTVRSISRTSGGFRIVTGPVPAPVVYDADAVVLATPANTSARLLAELAPAAATELASIVYSQVGVVSLAFAPGTEVAALTGILIPSGTGRTIKALTVMSRKWSRYRDTDPVVVRVSIGRIGDTSALRADDSELIAAATADVVDLIGAATAPVDAAVHRWGAALPQYAPGHLDRMARVGAAIADVAGLELAGAAYSGVGVPACIRTGQGAAGSIVAELAKRDRRAGRDSRGGESAHD